MNSFLRWVGRLSNIDAVTLVLATALASSMITMVILSIGPIAIVPLVLLLAIFTIVLLASKVTK